MGFFPASTDVASLSAGGAAFRWWRSPTAATVGRLQAACRELRQDYCRDLGIPMYRRATGGGAIFLDEGQIGFSAALHSALPAAELLALSARALSEALGIAGLDFRPPNDIERDGRKLGSVFLARDGDAVLIEGVILERVDIRRMLEALAVPTEKLSRDGLAGARERLVTLDEIGAALDVPRFVESLQQRLGEALGVAVWRPLAAPEALAVAPADNTLFSKDGPLEAIVRSTAAVLRARVVVDGAGRLADVALAVDGHALPPRLIGQLCLELLGRRPEDGLALLIGTRLAAAELVGFDAADVATVITLASEKARFAALAGLSHDRLMICDRSAAKAEEILARATVMLIPYCAKPAWCKYRQADDDYGQAELAQSCIECGQCEVGTAYALARERGMRAVTVRRYEHLVETLARMRGDGVEAYVGMCCSQFFTKRQRAFSAAGIPAVLADISGANCYELKQESEAYAGEFKAEARLDLDTLQAIMVFVPRREPRR